MLEVAVQRVDVSFAIGEPLTELAHLAGTVCEFLLALRDLTFEPLNGRRRFTVFMRALRERAFGALERRFDAGYALLGRGTRGVGLVDLCAGVCRRVTIVIGAAAELHELAGQRRDLVRVLRALRADLVFALMRFAAQLLKLS